MAKKTPAAVAAATQQTPVVPAPTVPVPVAPVPTPPPAVTTSDTAAKPSKKKTKKKTKKTAIAAPKNPSQKKGIDLKDRPFAVAVGNGKILKGSFKSVQEALDFIGTMPLKHRLKAWVGNFVPVEVTTSLTLKQ